ncbi:hypothetical protein [Streptomyces sp. NPDC052225]
MSSPGPDCVVLDIPQGPRLGPLGPVAEVGQVRVVADRAGRRGTSS